MCSPQDCKLNGFTVNLQSCYTHLRWGIALDVDPGEGDESDPGALPVGFVPSLTDEAISFHFDRIDCPPGWSGLDVIGLAQGGVFAAHIMGHFRTTQHFQ